MSVEGFPKPPLRQGMTPSLFQLTCVWKSGCTIRAEKASFRDREDVPPQRRLWRVQLVLCTLRVFFFPLSLSN